MQRKKQLSTIGYTAFLFATIVLYCAVCTFTMDDVRLYSLFLGDFSIGICSRFLIGSIISVFKDVITREWLLSFLRVITFSVFLITAHYLGSTLTKAEKDYKIPLVFFAGLFIACPFSITVYAGDIFGFIDVFCAIVLLMTAYFSENKILIWSAPVLMIAGVFIHDSFITGYMAPCLGIIAYIAVTKYGKKLWTSAIFIISSLAGILTSIYTVFFSRKTLRMNTDEVLRYLAKKGNTTVDDISGYIEDSVMWEDIHNVAPDGIEKKPVNYIYYSIKVAIDDLCLEDLLAVISIIPIIALVFYVWIKAIQKSSTPYEKIPYILFMLTPVPQIISLFMSNDFTRFLSTIVFTQVIYLFLTIRAKDKKTVDALKQFRTTPQMYLPACLSVLIMNIV